VLQTHPLQTQRIKDIRHVNGGKKMYQRGGVKMYQSPGLSLSP
jgi:predicted Zn-dependent protease